jgi:hypothetical protein
MTCPLGLVAGLLTISNLLLAQPAPPEPPAGQPEQESHWLRPGATNPADFELYGDNAAQFVHWEPAALRLTFPAKTAKARPFTGVIQPANVQGDFDIQVAFAILQEHEAAPPAKYSVRLGLILQLAGRKTIALSRTLADGEQRFVAFYQWHNAAGKQETLSKVLPTQAQTGRFRLVRTGSQLAYYASAGADKQFIPVASYEIGAEKLLDIRLAGQTGGTQAELDARFTNLRLQKGEVREPVVLAMAPPVARRRWLALLLTVVALLIVAVGLALAVYRRRSRDP